MRQDNWVRVSSLYWWDTGEIWFRMPLAGQSDLTFVTQEPQLGTGHAMMTVASELTDWEGPILVLCGDVPGLKPDTLQSLVAEHQDKQNSMTVLGMVLEDPKAYGRLITDEDQLIRIVEFRDASERERRVNLVNAGIYVFSAKPLLRALPCLSDNNDQREYYITDLVEILREQGQRVGHAICQDPTEVAGVNSTEELEELEKVLTKDKPH